MTVFDTVISNDVKFLLTCLLRGMTRENGRKDIFSGSFYSHASCEAWRQYQTKQCGERCFYSHASCEAWRICQCSKLGNIGVSTHMPLARHDRVLRCPRWRIILCFYSHASCEAWQNVGIYAIKSGVSTHMPLARHDLHQVSDMSACSSFYSHASCEAWLLHGRAVNRRYGFYSHASCEAWP